MLKSKYLGEMFFGFPSVRASEEEMAGTMMVYLRSVRGYDPEVVSEAAVKATQKGGAWPPSAPEFYELCNQVAARRFQREKLPLPAPPQPTYSREYRETMKERVDRLIADMKAGRLSPADSKFTIEQLADWNLLLNHLSPPYHMRIDAEGFPLKIPAGHPGAGHPVSYGYLTPAEAAWVKENRQRKEPAPDYRSRYETEF